MNSMLRPELYPPTEGRDECQKLVARAFRALEEGRTAEAERRLLEAHTGRRITASDLDAWFESSDPPEVAAFLTLPADLRVEDISRAELIEIVRRLMPTDELYDADNEAYWTALFEANVPRPDAASLVYYPPDDAVDARSWAPSADEVVELALSYRPIEL
jgi:hypothetical protein